MVENELKIRISPSDANLGMSGRGCWQDRSVRGVGRNRVRKMAKLALLIFVGAVVPVGRSLEGEAKHHNGHEDRDDPPGCHA